MKKIMIIIFFALYVGKIYAQESSIPSKDSVSYLISWLYMEDRIEKEGRTFMLKPQNEMVKVPKNYGMRELLIMLTTQKKNVMYMIARIPIEEGTFLLKKSDITEVHVDYVIINNEKKTTEQVHFSFATIIQMESISLDAINNLIEKEEPGKEFVITNIQQMFGYDKYCRVIFSPFFLYFDFFCNLHQNCYISFEEKRENN